MTRRIVIADDIRQGRYTAPPRPWTGDEIDQLVRLKGEGRSNQEIALALSRPIPSIKSRWADYCHAARGKPARKHVRGHTKLHRKPRDPGVPVRHYNTPSGRTITRQMALAIQRRLAELLRSHGHAEDAPLFPSDGSPTLADLETKPWDQWTTDILRMIGQLDAEG